MYDIWLCDDEAVHLRGLEEKIARILPDVQLRSFEDPEAVRAAARACLPDILIMDIEFGPASGIALADDLCDGVSKPIQVLYLTAYGERYCQRIFTGQVKPVGYLTKPVEDMYLSYHLRRCVQQIDARAKDQDVLTYQKNRALCSVPYREVLALESKGHTIQICARDGRTDGPFMAAWTSGRKSCRRNLFGSTRATSSTCATSTASTGKTSSSRGGRAVPISRSKQEETRTRYLLYRGARL